MRSTAAGGGGILRKLLAAMAAVHLLLLLSPWRFYTPTLGLDPAWIQVISHAAGAGWQWGRDIVFTYGPLGYLRNPIFDSAPLGPVLLWNGLLSLAVIAGVIGLLRHASTGGAIALYVMTAFAAAMRSPHAAYMMLPLFAALLHLRAPGAPTGVPIFLLVAAGVYANGYASMLALGLLTSALMDASQLLRRGRPLFTVAFLGAALGSYLLAGQSVASLLPYLRSLTDVVSGYADAMAVEGDAYETIAFLAVSAGALALVLRTEWPRLTDTRQRVDAGLLLLVIGAFWFVVWKSGFVRHDSHSVFAWRALAMGVAGYAAVTWPVNRSRDLRTAMIALVLASCSAIVLVGSGDIGPARLWAQVRAALVDAPRRSLEQGLHALVDPTGWKAERRATNESAYARMRSAFPYLQAAGPVDVVGLEQGALLAHGVDYRPQPVFQPFVAYTPSLIEQNRRHLASSRAASTLFVGSTTIDNHYPLSDLGQTLVELVSFYRPEEVTGEHLRLRRRATPREIRVTEMAAVDAALGDWVPIPRGSDAVMLQAELRPSALGSLARLGLRLPDASITVRLADGRERTHRIVPAIAANGFLLSPYAEASAILAGQSAGMLAETDASRVVAVKLDAGSPSARRYFDERTRVRLSRLEIPAGDGDAAPASLVRYFDRRATVTQLARSVAGTGQNVEARGIVLFAHAPATPEIMAAGGTAVRSRYGILEGAWTGDARTDGVCFRIRAIGADGQSGKLHERCLTPLERAEDRGEQEVTVRIDQTGPVRLVFETDCRGNCSWDWSYWKDIDVPR